MSNGLNKKKLIIYGNGHMARMIHQFVKMDFDAIAFTVDSGCISSETINDLPLIPFENISRVYAPEDYCMLIAVGYVEMNDVRELKYEEAKSMGYEFVNYIHSSVVLHNTLELGENNIILDYASIHPYSKLGNSNFISSNSNIGHGCKIGNSNWINSGVAVGGEAVIEEKVFLGVNSSVGHGLRIASQTFIGAGTQIARDTDEKGVYISSAGEKHRLSSQAFLKFSGVM